MSTALVKTHADLSASSAYRWMACGGSVRLSRGKKGASSIYAIEGTIAHQLAERALRGDLDPGEYVGLKLTDPETGTEVEVTEEMADHVRVFTDYCHSLIDGGIYGIETQFSLAKLNPPDDMFGTSDFWRLSMKEPGLLEIVDLKYGQGVPVEVKENEQEMYYGLGAVMEIQEKHKLPIDRVKLTIVQPRLAHADGPIRSWEISIEELLAFASHLLDRARAALSPDAPLVPGDHCRFCPAAGECPALSQHALDAAQMDFSDVVDAPPSPVTLTNDRLGRLLLARPMIEAFLNAAAAEAMSRVEQGGVIPGMKAVPKKASRKWTEKDEVELAKKLALRGFTKDQIVEESVRSVAQLEKQVGKKKFAIMVTNGPPIIEKISSGYTLAPIADVRPAALLGAQHDFEVLPNNAGQEETL